MHDHFEKEIIVFTNQNVTSCQFRSTKHELDV